MSPFLRGAGKDTSPKIQGIKEFSKTRDDISIDDINKFHKAINEHKNKNFKGARKLYTELLKKYEDNEVIIHNLDLI